MPRTTWEIELKTKGSRGAKTLARDLRDLDATLRSLGGSTGVLSRVSADAAALRGARVRVSTERRIGDETVRQRTRMGRAEVGYRQNARTEMNDSERVRRAVERAQVRGHELDGQRRYRAWQQRTRGEERASQRVAGLNARAWQRDQAEMARQGRWRERQAARVGQAAERARQRAERDTSATWRSRGGAVLDVGRSALGMGMSVAGATASALGTLVAMGGAAAALTAGIGGAVLEMVAFREASLTTLRAMARDDAGQHLTGMAADAQARRQFRFAQQFARQTPLDEQQVLDLQAQTSAAGFTGARNREVVSAAADVGALNPNDAGASGRFLLGLGQLRNASSVRTQDLRQTAQAANLGENDILRAVAREAGQTQRAGESDAAYNSRIQQMQQRGRFTGAQGVEGVLAALRERTGGEAGSFARAQGGTLTGTLSNLRSAVFSFVTSIEGIENLKGIRDLKNTLNGLVGILTGTSATTERLRTTFAKIVDDAGRFVAELGDVRDLEGFADDTLNTFREIYPVARDVGRSLGSEVWGRSATEIRLVFAAMTAGGVVETANHVAELGHSIGSLITFGIDVSAALALMADRLLLVTGRAIDLFDELASNPEMARDFMREIDPSNMSNVLALPGQSASSDLLGTFAGIGAQIPEGMRDGLAAGRDGLLGDMRALNADLAATTRSDLQIHSPSRLFANLGSQIPAGMSMGIDSGARDVARSLSSMVAPQGLPGFGVPGGLAGLGGATITFGDINVNASGASGGEEIAAEVREAVRVELERLFAMGGA